MITTPQQDAGQSGAAWFWRVVPGLTLLAGYRREWLRGDLVAGVILATYARA